MHVPPPSSCARSLEAGRLVRPAELRDEAARWRSAQSAKPISARISPSKHALGAESLGVPSFSGEFRPYGVRTLIEAGQDVPVPRTSTLVRL